MLSEDRPLLVVVDDAQWLDRGSLDALAFAARRLESEPLVLLLGRARKQSRPRGSSATSRNCCWQPLSTQDAGRLLDAQPHPPRGRAREQVLAQAAGNPMALIELSKVIAADPAAGRRWAASRCRPPSGSLPSSPPSIAALPRPARAALLLAAVADSPDLPAAVVPGLTAAALAPAENGGPDQGGQLGTAVQPSAGPLGGLPRRPVRRARRGPPDDRGHAPRPARPLRLAPGGSRTGTRRARGLAAGGNRRPGAAARRRRRGRAGSRARRRTQPREPDQARRLLAAASLALLAGQADWVQGTGHRGPHADRGPGPAHRRPAAYRLGARLVQPARRRARLAHLRRGAGIVTPAGHRLERIGLAATVAYQTGDRADRQAVLTTFDRMHEPCRASRTGRLATTTSGACGYKQPRTRSGKEPRPFPSCTGSPIGSS